MLIKKIQMGLLGGTYAIYNTDFIAYRRDTFGSKK